MIGASVCGRSHTTAGLDQSEGAGQNACSMRTIPFSRLCLLLLPLFFASPVRAEEISDEEVPEIEDIEGEERRLEVMQNRKYDLLHELALLGGGLPSDPYYKGLTGTVSYTLHFNHVLAWEVVQFTYSFNFDAKLKKELLRVARSQGEEAPEFPEIEWVTGSRLVLKPLYGKEALFNTEVVHLEVYLLGGPAFLKRGGAAESLAFGFDLGFGFRLWLAKWASFRVDLMELVYFLDQKPEQALHLHAGIAFNLRGEE